VVGPFGGWILPTAYLVIPAVAGLHLAGRPAEDYLREDGPRVAAALEWLLWLRAFGMLVVSRPPLGADAPVRLAVAGSRRPTAVSAALRLLTGLPAALLLFAAGAALLPAWLAGAAWLAVRGAVPAPVRALHLALLRAEAAFLARHASLSPPPRAPAAGGAGRATPQRETLRHSSAPHNGQSGRTRIPSFSFGEVTSRSHWAQRNEPVTSSPTSKCS
jgi:hypothetical protein